MKIKAEETRYTITQFDVRLATARTKLTSALKWEKKAGRVPAEDVRWRRTASLADAGLPPLSPDKLALLGRFKALGKPSEDAAVVLQKLYGRAVRTQDEAKALVRTHRPRKAPRVDDAALVGFLVQHVLGRGSKVAAFTRTAFTKAVAQDDKEHAASRSRRRSSSS